MVLRNAEEGKEYIIREIVTDDEELEAFLFSLGCYSGEPITVVSHISGGCIVSIKDDNYITIEVGTDRVKLVFDRSAISTVEDVEAENVMPN